MFLEWIVNLFLTLALTVYSIVRAILFDFLVMRGAEPDKKTHCRVMCTSSALVYVLLHFILKVEMFNAWLLTCGIGVAAAVLWELIGFWFRKRLVEVEDVLAGIRGLMQTSLWCWAYMMIRAACK